MGWVTERADADGKVRFMARYRDRRGRKRTAGTFTTERQAQRAWQRAERDQELGRIGDPNRGRQTLRTYVEQQWFPNHRIEKTTRENYRYALDKHILPELGDFQIGDILPNDVREWIQRLHGTLGVNPPTIAKCKLILDAIFTTAVNDQVVFFHVGKGVKTPPVAPDPVGSSPPSSTRRSTPRCPRTCDCWWRPTSSPGCAGENSPNYGPRTSTPSTAS